MAGKGDIKAGRAFVELSVKDAQLQKGLLSAKQRLHSFGGGIMAFGGVLSAGLAGAQKTLNSLAGTARFVGGTLNQLGGIAFRAGGLITGPFLAALMNLDEAKSMFAEMGSSLTEGIGRPLLPILAKVRDVVLAFAEWGKRNPELIRQIFLVGAGIVAAGGVLTALGSAAMIVAAGLSAAASVMGALAAIVSTVGLPVIGLTAALVGGVFAWARFTESGRASVQALIDYFAPLLQVARDAIGGIGDALMAGNLSLAGQIAVTALKLIFLQGIQQIADAIGGPIGAALKTIGVDLIQGDLAGVWDTVVKGMAVAWDGFALGVLQVFKSVIDGVGALWAGMIAGISSSIAGLQLAAQEAGLGSVAKQLGFLRRGVQGLGAIGTGAATLGASAVSAVEAAQKKRLGDSAESFFDKITTGSAEGDAKVKALQEELAALREEAAKGREAAELKRPTLATAGSETLAGAKATVTFSGAALLAAGQGGGVANRIAAHTKKTAEGVAEVHKDTITLRDKKPLVFGV